MALWGALQANATVTLHAAGWLEGGLSFGYEKFINDVEALQTIAELCVRPTDDPESLAWSALADVQPGGHFFATEHTMERYKTAFYEPLVADLNNFGTWSAAGGKTSSERATEIWRSVLRDFQPPKQGAQVGERIASTIEAWKARGGAVPPG
jgi:trimethylamine--corrinoid protein Co-methyltransferase